MKPLLSPTQRAIVERTEGAALVLAAAGSGKTRVLAERIRHVLETRKGHFKVLGLTFTNKAAAEMKERLADVPDLSEKAFIGTIHAFCQMLLDAHGQTIGLARSPVILEREADCLALLEEVVLGDAILHPFIDGKPEKDRRKWLYDVLGFISAKKRQLTGLPGSEGTFGGEEGELVYRLFNERLSSQDSIDFDDILLLAYRILTERPHVAQLYTRIYRYVCVDEAQDLNFAQYALIRTLAAPNANVLMVGSPNQAIYGFNGSDTRYMLQDFKADFSVTQYELTENYRSARSVIRAANSLFPESPMDESAAPIPGECSVEGLLDEQQEAAWVVTKVGALLAAGEHPDIEAPLSLKGMAVLARNRYVFAGVEAALKQAGVPCHYKRGASDPALESEFVQAFDLGVRMLVNPMDGLHWSQLRGMLKCSSDAEAARSGIGRLRSLGPCAGAGWEHGYSALLSAWTSIDRDVNAFGQAVEGLKRHCGDDSRLNGATEDAAEMALVLEDLTYLAENWRKYALATQPDARTLGHFRNQMAMGLTTPLDERDGIALATVHSVKGLEFDVVFLIGMTEGTFPDYRAVKEGGKALAEERNDAYVAVTRARRLLFITYPQSRVMPWDRDTRSSTPQKPSRFVTGLSSYGVRPRVSQRDLMVAEE